MRLVGRRLPDLLIGILIVVLALGLGSLLLTQRNRAATTPSALTPPPASTAAIPAAPGTAVQNTPATDTQAVTLPDTNPTDAGQNAATPVTDSSQTSSVPAANQSGGTLAPAQTQPDPAQTAPPITQTPATGPVATSPLAPPITPQPDTSQPPVTTTPAPTDQPATPTTDQPATPAPPAAPAATTPPPRVGNPVATSENRTPLRRDYRISLGTFGSVPEASASTAAVTALGYTVYPIELGSQVVAQVGPFANATEANAALSDILRAYGGAVLYAPRPSVSGNLTPATSGSSSASSQDTAPPSSAASSPAATQPAPVQPAPTPPAQAAAPSGPVYLQVGAFDRQESATRLVGMLDNLGYNPSVQAPEGKKVTVLIGPFSGDALLRAENKLGDNGFDHFRVR